MLPGLTGKFVDANGVEHSRYDYVRDPDVAAYDDPNDPYDSDYAILGMPRDVATYGFRLSRQDEAGEDHFCDSWYDNQPWDETVWGETPACPGFDFDRMYLERLLDVARRFDTVAALDPRLVKVTRGSELRSLIEERKSERNRVGGLLSTEGLYFRSDVSTPEGEARLRSTFDELYAAGFRMFSLTHFIDNDHGGSATGMGKAIHGDEGLPVSSAGRRFAELVLDHHSLLDVAHASAATTDDLVELATERRIPLVFSHGGLSEGPQTDDDSCATSRNLSDDLVVKIASTGGVIGIGFAPEFVCGLSPLAWAATVRHAVDIIDAAHIGRFGADASDPSVEALRGVDHVGLGSDYDGGIEAYTDIANLNQYTEALTCEKSYWRPNCLERPFTEREAHQILGGNTLRVMSEVLAD